MCSTETWLKSVQETVTGHIVHDFQFQFNIFFHFSNLNSDERFVSEWLESMKEIQGVEGTRTNSVSSVVRQWKWFHILVRPWFPNFWDCATEIWEGVWGLGNRWSYGVLQREEHLPFFYSKGEKELGFHRSCAYLKCYKLCHAVPST
jgi:hypothetical protein